MALGGDAIKPLQRERLRATGGGAISTMSPIFLHICFPQSGHQISALRRKGIQMPPLPASRRPIVLLLATYRLRCWPAAIHPPRPPAVPRRACRGGRGVTLQAKPLTCIRFAGRATVATVVAEVRAPGRRHRPQARCSQEAPEVRLRQLLYRIDRLRAGHGQREGHPRQGPGQH